MGLLHRIKEEAIRIKTIMPRFLQLEISRVCNLKCAGCYMRESSSLSHFKGERYLTLKALKEIVKLVPTAKTITFLGDGEPLMNPELGDIVRYLSGKGISSWITTNGNLLTPEIVDEWGRGKVIEAHISLDTTHKELYEKIRIGGSFEKVMGAIEIVGRSRVPLFINTLGYQETIKDLPDIVKLAGEVNCKAINLLVPIFMLGSDIEDSLTRIKDDEVNKAILQEAIDLARRSKISWIGGDPTLSPFFRHCNLPFGLPYITLEGDIYGCCYTVGGGRTEWYQGIPQKVDSPNYLMGNIYNSPFKDIWQGRAYKELRGFIKATEKTRGREITPGVLQFLRGNKTDSRFAYCESCLWRWGSAC